MVVVTAIYNAKGIIMEIIMCSLAFLHIRLKLLQ